MGILEILSQFFGFIISFLPRYTIIKTTHAGVKFARGNNVVELNSNNGIFLPVFSWPGLIYFKRSGIHIYWPLITEFVQVPIKRQTTKLEKQILTTKDGMTILVTGIVVYEVEDVVKLLTETWDYDDTIKDYATVCIQQTITTNNFIDIQNINLNEFLRKNLKPFGIKVIRVNLCDCATGKALLHMGISVENNIFNGAVYD